MNGPIPLVLGLGAAPPSNAAHMLGWWLGERADRWERLVDGLHVRPGWVEEVLAGRVEPAAEMIAAIAALTLGRVPHEEWTRGVALDWLDKPLGWSGPPWRYTPASARGESA